MSTDSRKVPSAAAFAVPSTRGSDRSVTVTGEDGSKPDAVSSTDCPGRMLDVPTLPPATAIPNAGGEPGAVVGVVGAPVVGGAELVGADVVGRAEVVAVVGRGVCADSSPSEVRITTTATSTATTAAATSAITPQRVFFSAVRRSRRALAAGGPVDAAAAGAARPGSLGRLAGGLVGAAGRGVTARVDAVAAARGAGRGVAVGAGRGVAVGAARRAPAADAAVGEVSFARVELSTGFAVPGAVAAPGAGFVGAFGGTGVAGLGRTAGVAALGVGVGGVGVGVGAALGRGAAGFAATAAFVAARKVSPELLAAGFFATGFLATGFRATEAFFATGFLAAGLRAPVALVAGFFGAAFLAVAFFGTGFFAAGFFAAAFEAVDRVPCLAPLRLDAELATDRSCHTTPSATGQADTITGPGRTSGAGFASGGFAPCPYRPSARV